MFQSPRSGKFVSDTAILATLAFAAFAFQSPRSGKFVSDAKGPDKVGVLILFQSPRSGKFVSDYFLQGDYNVKFYCFNPLDRGNLYQMQSGKTLAIITTKRVFQSPRSGKFVSDKVRMVAAINNKIMFQSPRSGKFVSDSPKNACKLTMSFKRTTLCRHYITNGKMFENVAKKIF